LTIDDVSESATIVTEFTVVNSLLTANWVVLGGRRYARLGVLAGLGFSEYKVSETNDPGVSRTSSTSGPAGLAGIYVDWGADGLGGRFGVQYLATELEDIDGASVDVSGRDITFDIRWAF
jgi:hypothetical protein